MEGAHRLSIPSKICVAFFGSGQGLVEKDLSKRVYLSEVSIDDSVTTGHPGILTSC